MTVEEIQETYQAFLGAFPDGRIGYGVHLPDADLRALNALARQDGFRVELVGYSGSLDYSLVPLEDIG